MKIAGLSLSAVLCAAVALMLTAGDAEAKRFRLSTPAPKKPVATKPADTKPAQATSPTTQRSTTFVAIGGGSRTASARPAAAAEPGAFGPLMFIPEEGDPASASGDKPEVAAIQTPPAAPPAVQTVPIYVSAEYPAPQRMAGASAAPVGMTVYCVVISSGGCAKF